MRTLIFIFFWSMCSCQPKNSPEEVLNEGRRLADKGDYKGALEKYLWFHNHALEIDQSFYGVRLSFALANWVELGKKYPKALEKLKSIREEKTQKLLAGETSRELFHDVESINDYLNESKATVELFKRIETTNSVFAAKLYDLADPALLKAKEFDLAKKYLGNPEERLENAKQNFESGMEFAKKSPRSREAFEQIFADKITGILIVLRETDDLGRAESIQVEALKILNNEEIRNALE